MNGVIETATGDLLRMGCTDFANDGSFDSATETVVTDISDRLLIRDDPWSSSYHSWNGNQWVACENVRKMKDKKNAEIDAGTQDIIAAGFSYDGSAFSLSAAAQRNLADLYFGVAAGVMSLPKKVSTKSVNVEYEVTTSEVLEALFAASRSAIEGALQDGRDLKKLVEACVSVAEVDAIVDSR